MSINLTIDGAGIWLAACVIVAVAAVIVGIAWARAFGSRKR